MDNKKLKKLRQMIAASHKKAYDTGMYPEFYVKHKTYGWHCTVKTLYKPYEIFTKKRYFSKLNKKDPCNQFNRIIKSEFNFKIHIINLEELAQEAFKPERLMYQLSFDPDYSE